MIGGMDDQLHFFVRAYDAETGTPLWEDRVDDPGQVGQVSALTLGGSGEEGRGDQDQGGNRVVDGRFFAVGVSGCDTTTFLECELALRAYDGQRGLVWQRADAARGGDWGFLSIATGAGDVFVGGNELLGDGQYHTVVRSYAVDDGDFRWATLFDEGGGSAPFGFTGFVGSLLVRSGWVFVSGNVFRSDGGGDFLVRRYRARRQIDCKFRHLHRCRDGERTLRRSPG